MAEPVVVTIPHKLTKEEAVRRLKKGFGDVRSTVGEKFVVLTDDWAGDHLDFRASLLGQTTTGTVEGAPGEQWGNIHDALRHGRRGLPGGMGLSSLIRRRLSSSSSPHSPSYRSRG